MADIPRNDRLSLISSSADSRSALPHFMHADAPSAADQARRRLLRKPFFLCNAFSWSRRSHLRLPVEQLDQFRSPEPQHDRQPSDPEQPVVLEYNVLSDTELGETCRRDVYKWAVLYENQRGLTLFSTPYYSPLSLLPLDPPPFTIPSASRSSRAGQPTVSLASYPLPDGTWRWVSRSWMVDMRGDGQTQYDGFQYNWFFRSRNWRPEAGNLSSGGWVRRRRWIRLMMRPAQVPEISASRPGQRPVESAPLPAEEGATRPPSVISLQDSSLHTEDVWDGNEEDDWMRCRIALRRVGRDGRKLELWKQWIGRPAPTIHSVGHSSLNLSTSLPLRRPASASAISNGSVEAGGIPRAPKHRIASLLRYHGSEILQSFVYPESRSQFIELLANSGLLAELQTTPGAPGPLAMLDFWSLANSLDRLSELDSSH